MTAIEGDSITVFEREGIAVRAARELAAAVREIELADVDSPSGPRRQLLGDGELLGTFPAGPGSLPLAEVAGERWESTSQGWYLAVIEHGHWVYVFEADLDSLLALEGANTCQRHGRSGDVRVEHVEGVWHCVPADAYRRIRPDPSAPT